MINTTNFINFLKFFLFGRGIICASLLIVFLISSIIYLFYVDIKGRYGKGGLPLFIISILFIFISIVFLSRNSDLKEIGKLKEISKEIIEKEHINSFEREKYEEILKEKIELSLIYNENEREFFNYLQLNHNLVKLLKEENLSKDEEIYREKLLIHIEIANKKANEMIFFN